MNCIKKAAIGMNSVNWRISSLYKAMHAKPGVVIDELLTKMTTVVLLLLAMLIKCKE